MREINGAKVAAVLPDNFAGTNMAARHLLERGYRKIAFLGGRETISDVLMPETNDHQLFSIVKAKYPSIKIQLVSGFTNS